MWRVGFVGLLVARVVSADCEVGTQPPVSVEVVGTTATLTFGGRTRVIHAKTCDELTQSVAVVIEMVLSALGAEPAIDPPTPTDIPPAPPMRSIASSFKATRPRRTSTGTSLRCCMSLQRTARQNGRTPITPR
ncbi:MAG TPA: hypothetical protein VF403_10920 [Kofleriaceae bacterium]